MSTTITSIPTLCEECSAIVYDVERGDAIGAQNSSRPWKRTDAYPDLPKLRASASAGCTFCELLCFMLRERLPVPYVRELGTTAAKDVTITLGSPAYVRRSHITDYTRDLEPDRYKNERDGIYWLAMIFESSAWSNAWNMTAMAYGRDDAVSDHLGINLRMPVTNVLDESCIGLLKDCVARCLNKHTGCKLFVPRSLPTRLIDVGGRDDTTARLITSNSLQPSTPYIALSYCWGPPSQSNPQLVTTTASFPKHQKAIGLADMPQTIRDAVIFTRHMGIKYIWVDALCIIQDDAEDWAKEAALMFAVYRYATITVVAAAGDTCHSGFLQRKGPGPCAIVPFQSKTDGVEVTGSYLLSHMRERRTWDADYPSHMHQRSWATRAWTYQEDIMSTRVLYFDNVTSFFRCQTERRLEHSITSYTNVFSWNKSLSPATKGVSAEELTKSKASLYERWGDLVNEYSRRKLTVPDDKLPAISGLARTFGSALEDQYVAGLWKRDLIRGMLWLTDFEATRPARWRAPSWSWASWDADLGLTLKHSLPLVNQCFIEAVNVVEAGPDAFGRVKDAWMILSAACVPVTVQKVPEPETERDTYLAELRFYDDRDVVALGSFDAVTTSGIRNEGNWRPPDVEPFVGMTGISALVLALRCIPLEVDDDTGKKYSAPLFPTGLLVTKSKDHRGSGSPEVYERIGLFRTDTMRQANAWKRYPRTRIKLV
ncbi:HET-domain-containing protein [Colletotrichum zoysiae]|uniref:HET-domain-containing protein n=1 Tax=Colletotrichum zoysiae TaxID=1216348 RepID=A0AAD9HMP1_9PEZI|nr:HET-domain-containing protein [Colletotrichum zoysiae]